MFHRFQGVALWFRAQIGKLGTEKCGNSSKFGEAKTMPKGGVIQFSAMDENYGPKNGKQAGQVKYSEDIRMIFEFGNTKNVSNFSC